jgi:hypothetical protein
MAQDVAGCSIIFHRVPGCPKMLLDVSERSRMIQNVPECSRMSQDVAGCSIIFHRVPGCPRMLLDVSERSRMLQNVPECSRMFQDDPWFYRKFQDCSCILCTVFYTVSTAA